MSGATHKTCPQCGCARFSIAAQTCPQCGHTVQRFAKVPAETGRAGYARTAPHTATAGTVQGRGTSQRAALDDLGTMLTAAMARAGSDTPSFAWDAANQALSVAVPDVMHGGSVTYMVRFDDNGPLTWFETSGNACEAKDAFATSVGTAIVPRR
jgi:uncharacterized Zn finger protein (UPF0148 family)